MNTPPKQMLKRNVPDEHVGVKGIAAHMAVAFNEQAAVVVEEDLFIAPASTAKSPALELTCTPPPRMQYGVNKPEKQLQKQKCTQ